MLLNKRILAVVIFAMLLSITIIVSNAKSEWSVTPPNAIYVTKTQYRSRAKEFQDSSSSVLSGWTLDHSTPGEWGAWISNGQTAIQAETDREVRTVNHAAVTELTGYSYWRYEYKASDGKTYYTYGRNYADSQGYSVTRRDLTTTVAGRLPTYKVYDGIAQSYGQQYNFWFYETPIYSVVTPAYTEYQYRTRSRTYTFYRWLSWSAWQDEPITASANIQVETRQLYAPDETVLRSSIRVGVDQEVPMLSGTGMQLLYENNGSDLYWTSSNPQIASVSQRGYLSAHSAGTATITVTRGGTSAAISAVVKAWQGLTMPAQLTGIDESAFEGDSFEMADLRNSRVTRIEEKAFANNQRLRMVFMGSALTDLAGTAFSGSDHAVLVYPSNQLAANFVQANNNSYYVLGEANPYIRVSSVSIRPATETITPRGTLMLTAEIQPADATQPGVVWRSSNTSVATVSETGQVTGVAVGTAVITATAKDNSSITASCTITVQPIQAQSITLNQTNLSLVKGNTATLTATVLPTDASNPAIVWSSSNPAAATVSQTGVVTAVAAGSSVITARVGDGSGVEATCTVTVLADVVISDSNFTSIYENNITQTDATVRFKINLSGVPTSGGFYFGTTSTNLSLVKSETYSSTVTEVFFNLNKYGKTLTANTTYYYQMYYVYQGVTYKTTVHSFTTLPNVTITPTSGSVEVGQNETAQLNVSTAPAGATVTWASSDASIATVSSSGVVTGIKGGTVTITATAQYVNSTGTASFTVSVNPIRYHVLLIVNYRYSKSQVMEWYNVLASDFSDWIEEHDFLGIVNSGEIWTPNPAKVNDAEGVARAYRALATRQGTTPDVHIYTDVSKSRVLSLISETFANSDYNDVNLFYYGGHGAKTAEMYLQSGETIAPVTLAAKFNDISGNNIVLASCCYAGGFAHTMTNYPYATISGIAACSASEPSWSKKYGGTDYSLDIYSFLKGIGFDGSSTMYADTNGDGKVTLGEIASYMSSGVSSDAAAIGETQHLQQSLRDASIIIYER